MTDFNVSTFILIFAKASLSSLIDILDLDGDMSQSASLKALASDYSFLDFKPLSPANSVCSTCCHVRFLYLIKWGKPDIASVLVGEVRHRAGVRG